MTSLSKGRQVAKNAVRTSSAERTTHSYAPKQEEWKVCAKLLVDQCDLGLIQLTEMALGTVSCQRIRRLCTGDGEEASPVHPAGFVNS